MIDDDQPRAAFVTGCDLLEPEAVFELPFADMGDTVEDRQAVAVELGEIALKRHVLPSDLKYVYQPYVNANRTCLHFSVIARPRS